MQATNSRKLLWDEENRLLALSDNGFVSNYWYDAAGERTVKESGGSEGVSVNGVLSGARTETTNFTAYISPYMVVNNGGYYSKHIYIGSQRIVSKLGSSDIFAMDPTGITLVKAGSKDFTAKYSLLTGKIKERFDSLGVVYKGTSQGSAGMITSTAGRIPISLKYYFHSDHLGSSSLITDATGGIVQHLEYIPFGEVFIDERPSASSWSTPYKFNAKELDEETGLYYYGARYYDPRTSVWISVDPLAEKYPNVGSYVYCLENPTNYIDPDGQKVVGDSKSQINIKNTLTKEEAKSVVFDKNGNLNNNELNKCESNSENMTALKAQSNSKAVYSYEVVDSYVDATGKKWDLKADPKQGTVGLTSVPNGKEAPSKDGNVHILVSNKANKRQQASTTAHEGYGHAYFYLLSKTNNKINPWHDFGIVRTQMEYEPFFKKNIPVGIQGEKNTKLKNRINIVVQQTLRNYDNK